MTRWEIIATDEYEEWEAGLNKKQKESITERVDRLQELGPTLGRPDADLIKGSKIQNLKELRISQNGSLRILFVFDPFRKAVLLIGGDKAKNSEWNKWYQRMVPIAEDIYERYLTQGKEEKR